MYKFLLDCGHTVSAVDNGEGYCPKCQTTYSVIEEWHAKCHDCPFGARTGSSFFECTRKAGRHARSRPGHHVDVYKPDGTLHRSVQWDIRPMVADSDVPF